MEEFKKAERKCFDYREAHNNLTEQLSVTEGQSPTAEQIFILELSEQFGGEIIVDIDDSVWMSERYLRMYAEFGTYYARNCLWAKFHPQLMFFLRRARAMAQYEYRLNHFRNWRNDRDE